MIQKGTPRTRGGPGRPYFQKASSRMEGCLLAVTLLCWATAPFVNAVYAQANPVAKEQEVAEIREELQRIIKEEPEKAADAQMALDKLNEPESSRAGRLARNRREMGSRRIVNGLLSRSHPAVGALLAGSNPHAAPVKCTGTLVGCDKFLTAAHCIVEDPSPGSYLVFFQELGFYRIKEIRWEHDKYKFPEPYFDLAMLTLERPVEGIAAMPINTTVEPLNKSIVTLVGFGRTGGSRRDYGIKREGTAKLSACPEKYANGEVSCWHYDADVITKDSAQNTCDADSGGGVFMRDPVEKVFGVVSGGTDYRSCERNDTAVYVDVFQYRDWIERAGEGRLQPGMCGRPLWTKQAGEPVRKKFRLGPAGPEDRFAVEVPEGSRGLRVGMNAEDNGFRKNAFEISVFRGQDSTNGSDECKGTGTGQFAFCEIGRPQPGPFTIALTRKKGEGDVQVTALSVASD